MAIAVTPFDGFCGFRPLDQIVSFLKAVPPLRALVGEAKAENFITTVQKNSQSSSPSVVTENKSALKNLFEAIMTAPESIIKTLSQELVILAVSSSSQKSFGGTEFGGAEFASLIQRLNSQFPNDVGLFCAFVLNYIKLQPGEAMFLEANSPHAYLSGDIMECMAASDNVVRAGFTPKFKDVKTLVEILTYSYAPIEEQKMKPVPFPKGSNSSSTPTSVLYDPPIEEFAVVKTSLEAAACETFEPIDGPSILIVTEGSGAVSVGPKKETLKSGLIYFIGATAAVELAATQKEGLVVFRAFCELK
jgi:mannose-6-phosphate isomerase